MKKNSGSGVRCASHKGRLEIRMGKHRKFFAQTSPCAAHEPSDSIKNERISAQ
jgi:hypothetical protein